jgi:dihydrodiol dehydrogenase / D-xylose 1-dehydrogenase (NADP)
MSNPTRWGILSAGKISNDFVAAMLSLDPKEHQVVAVGARNLKSAQDFAKEHNIGQAYGSYEELLKDPKVGECHYLGFHHVVYMSWARLSENTKLIVIIPRCCLHWCNQSNTFEPW